MFTSARRRALSLRRASARAGRCCAAREGRLPAAAASPTAPRRSISEDALVLHALGDLISVASSCTPNCYDGEEDEADVRGLSGGDRKSMRAFARATILPVLLHELILPKIAAALAHSRAGTEAPDADGGGFEFNGVFLPPVDDIARRRHSRSRRSGWARVDYGEWLPPPASSFALFRPRRILSTDRLPIFRGFLVPESDNERETTLLPAALRPEPRNFLDANVHVVGSRLPRARAHEKRRGETRRRSVSP